MTVIDTALHDHLRALKLSGMLQTLDARLAQAHAGDLGHLDFLQVLCHDEITRRDTMSMQRRIHRARFEQQATLEEFDFAASPKLPAAAIRDLAALRWLHAGESIILHGPVGVGKSHIAQALGHLAIRQGADVRFTKTSRALADLAGGHADRTWPRRLAELTRPDVLILDLSRSWDYPEGRALAARVRVVVGGSRLLLAGPVGIIAAAVVRGDSFLVGHGALVKGRRDGQQCCVGSGRGPVGGVCRRLSVLAGAAWLVGKIGEGLFAAGRSAESVGGV
jgi:energy-coupling factor transporter ATP-binding protein EcfA2